MFGKGKERDISVTLQSTKGSKKKIVTASMMAHTCDPSSPAEASESRLSSRPSRHTWCVLGLGCVLEACHRIKTEEENKEE